MDLVLESSESSTSISVEPVETNHTDETESDPHQNQPLHFALFVPEAPPHYRTKPNTRKDGKFGTPTRRRIRRRDTGGSRRICGGICVLPQ